MRASTFSTALVCLAASSAVVAVPTPQTNNTSPNEAFASSSSPPTTTPNEGLRCRSDRDCPEPQVCMSTLVVGVQVKQCRDFVVVRKAGEHEADASSSSQTAAVQPPPVCFEDSDCKMLEECVPEPFTPWPFGLKRCRTRMASGGGEVGDERMDEASIFDHVEQRAVSREGEPCETNADCAPKERCVVRGMDRSKKCHLFRPPPPAKEHVDESRSSEAEERGAVPRSGTGCKSNADCQPNEACLPNWNIFGVFFGRGMICYSFGEPASAAEGAEVEDNKADTAAVPAAPVAAKELEARGTEQIAVVSGRCTSDADCPALQICDRPYLPVSRGGNCVPYYAERGIGEKDGGS